MHRGKFLKEEFQLTRQFGSVEDTLLSVIIINEELSSIGSDVATFAKYEYDACLKGRFTFKRNFAK